MSTAGAQGGDPPCPCPAPALPLLRAEWTTVGGGDGTVGSRPCSLRTLLGSPVLTPSSAQPLCHDVHDGEGVEGTFQSLSGPHDGNGAARRQGHRCPCAQCTSTAGATLKGERVPWGHSHISACDLKTLGSCRTKSGSVQRTVGQRSMAGPAETSWSCRCVTYTRGLCWVWSDGAGGEMCFITRLHLGVRRGVYIPRGTRVLFLDRSRIDTVLC